MKTLHDLVVDKLEQADPAAGAALLRIPLENIDRWLANGRTAPHRLEQWRQILLRAQQSPEGFLDLLRVLRDDSEPAQRLRDFAPFAGVVTREDRHQAAPNAPTISNVPAEFRLGPGPAFGCYCGSRAGIDELNRQSAV